jgi:hypothetical protein
VRAFDGGGPRYLANVDPESLIRKLALANRVLELMLEKLPTSLFMRRVGSSLLHLVGAIELFRFSTRIRQHWTLHKPWMSMSVL